MASWGVLFSILILKYKHSSSVVELFDVDRFGIKFFHHGFIPIVRSFAHKFYFSLGIFLGK